MKNIRAKLNKQECNAIIIVIDWYFLEIKDYVDFFNLKSLYRKLFIKIFDNNGVERNRNKKLSVTVNINEYRSWKIVYTGTYEYLKTVDYSILAANRIFYEQLDKQSDNLRSLQISETHK